MAKSKTKKTKARPIDEEEPQVKADDEATEIAEDAEVEDFTPQKKARTKGKTKVVEEDEATELAEDAEAEDFTPQKNAKTKAKTKAVDDDEPQVKAGDEATEVAEDAEATELAEDENAVQLKDEEKDADFGFDEDEADDTKVEGDDAEPPADKDADEDEDDEDSMDDGPKAPPAKTTKLAIFLILCNWIAAPAFLTVAYLDHAKRAEFSYRTLINYVQVWGLPLRCEEPGATDASGKSTYDPFYQETRPRLSLTTKQLEDALRARPGADKKVIKEGAITFAPYEESIIFDKDKFVSATRIPYRLRPSDMKTPGLLKDVFLSVAEPVETLEAEIERLQTKLPGQIAEAAGEVKEALKSMKEADKRKLVKEWFLPHSYDPVLKKEKEAELDKAAGAELDALVKRAMVRKVLFTIAWNVAQVEVLDDQMANATGAKLDEMLDDALQRRMYYDLLAPVNIFWSSDISKVENYKIERMADVTSYPPEKLKELLDQRLKAAIADTYDKELHIGDHWEKEAGTHGMKRTSVEKRRQISFILFALSQVSAPTLDKKLVPKGIERAQVVCGLSECTNAMIYYTRAQRVLEERYVAAVKADRDGTLAVLKEGKLVGLPSLGGFPAEFEELINRLVSLKSKIDTQERRLKDLQEQRDFRQNTQRERARQHRAALDKLLKARQITEDDLKNLEKLQVQLHDAHLELSEAGERNLRLIQEIETLTRIYEAEDRRLESLQKKGKKRP